MGYDLYFINHSTKEYISHKKTTNDFVFEQYDYLLTFLQLWQGDTIEILGEEKIDGLDYINNYKSLDELKWHHPDIKSTDDLIRYYQKNKEF